MKRQFLLISFLSIGFFSCDIEVVEPNSKNEVKATIILSNGSTLHINAKGSNARMSNTSWWGRYVEGTEGNTVSITVMDTGSSLNITGPGTYPFDCEFTIPYSNVYGIPSASRIYRHDWTEPGNLTLTQSNADYMEGFFSTVICRSVNDSVRISGTFKGDHLGF